MDMNYNAKDTGISITSESDSQNEEPPDAELIQISRITDRKRGYVCGTHISLNTEAHRAGLLNFCDRREIEL